MNIFKLVDGMNQLIRWVLALLLAGMVVCTFWQVMVRFLFSALNMNVSAPWTEEIARYLMIWVIFFGAAVACRHSQLISLDIVVHSVPKRLGLLLRYLAIIVCLFFYLLVVQLGLQFLEFGAIESSPVLSLPKTWVYVAMPIGFVLMIVNTLTLVAETWIKHADIRFAGQDSLED